MKRKVCEGRISSPFGTRKHPITGEYKFHNGVDIACPVGTPVYSPVDGRVTYAKMCPYGGGLTIRISCLDKYFIFSFAHLYEIQVKYGDVVKKGQKIALSGNTGSSTGAHLHFGVKNLSSFIDPVKYIEFEDEC